MFFNNGACTVLTCDCHWPRTSARYLSAFLFAQLLMQQTARSTKPPTAPEVCRGQDDAPGSNRASGGPQRQTLRRQNLTRSRRVRRCRKLIQHQNMVVFACDVRQRRHFCKCGDTASSSRSATRKPRRKCGLHRPLPVYSPFRFNAFCSPHSRFTQDAINHTFGTCQLGAQKLSMRCPLRQRR